MKNIKGWIDYINETEDSQYSVYDCDFILMERYANYKTKQLDDLILSYCLKLNGLARQDFEKHFNIQTNRYGGE